MEGYHIFILIFAVLCLNNTIGFIFYINLQERWDVFVPMPSDFKYETEMNWFGCIVCYIFLFLIFPIFNICKFIYWLFHI